MASALKKRVKALEISNKKRRDFDPEDDPFSKNVDDSDDSDVESEVDGQITGREHYENVSTSRLRQPEKVELDEKKYGGQPVSRAALQDEDDDDLDPFAPTGDDEDEDPFAIREKQVSDSDEVDDDTGDGDSDGELPDLDAMSEDIGEDDEIDSDEAFGDGEEESFKRQGFVFRGSGKNRKQAGLDGQGSELDEEAGETSRNGLEDSDQSSDSFNDDSDVEMNGTEDEEEPDDDTDASSEDDGEASARPGLRPLNSEREKLKSVLFADTAAVATSLSQAASADATKGMAVRQQYQTFDRLLDARIKLQKGFTAVNETEMKTQRGDSEEEAQSALKKAEEAAVRLYATIESLRHSIVDANASTQQGSGKKRKSPPPITTATTNTDILTRMKDLEEQSLPHRRSILDRWSNKTRAVTSMSSQSTSKLNPEKQQTKISSVLDTYLLTESDKLISQSTTSTTISDTSRTAASAPAPDTDNNNNNPSHATYNDTIYYQSLLRDLIASRARSNPNASATSSTLPSTSDPLPLKLHASGNTRRKDTKASKGRKVRYTVHEKLENFMAATGRDTGSTGQWTDAAVREFFGSLMGNKGQLDEDDDDDNDEKSRGVGGDGEINGNGEEDRREVEALRLFRS